VKGRVGLPTKDSKQRFHSSPYSNLVRGEPSLISIGIGGKRPLNFVFGSRLKPLAHAEASIVFSYLVY
jgi:hypothetical protein